MRESGQLHLLKAFFLPPNSNIKPKSTGFDGLVPLHCILSSHTALIRRPISQFAIDTLGELCKVHTFADIFDYLFSLIQGNHREMQIDGLWADYLSSLFSIPGRLMNATSDGKLKLPDNLETRKFLENLCRHFYKLLTSTSFNRREDDHCESLAIFLGRLFSEGCFPTTPAYTTLLSFWSIVLPLLCQDLKNSFLDVKSERPSFSPILSHLPTTQKVGIVHSLLAGLNLAHPVNIGVEDVGTDATVQVRSVVKREASILQTILGQLFPSSYGNSNKEIPLEGTKDTWSLVSGLFDKALTEGRSRVIVCWAATSQNPVIAFGSLLARATEIWTDEDRIKHSTLSQHRAATCLLLTTVSNLRVEPSSPYSGKFSAILNSLSRNATFINAVGFYIGHLDASIRRCGLLVAETVAGLTGGKLHFGDWDGAGEGRDWAKEMRILMEDKDADSVFEWTQDDVNDPQGEVQKDGQGLASSKLTETPKVGKKTRKVVIMDKEGDSDDSLEGYESDSISSRSPSPTLDDSISRKRVERSNEPTIEEINADPTLLNPSKKKIRKPVYLLDLGKLFKVPNEGDVQAESIQIGLDSAAALIRKKAGWGTELEENAVDLTCNIIGLQNNYDLEGFDQLVLEALTALVACCPKKVAPCIIENFFMPSYSVTHRYAMLNALALGARELAGLPTPQIALRSSTFPSRILPISAHHKYITAEDEQQIAPIRGLVECISSQAIDKAQKRVEDKVPEIAREKQLTVFGRRKAGITELQSLSDSKASASRQPTRTLNFNVIAAEYFIIPINSRFWSYLRESISREEASSRFSQNGGFKATGTGMILSPLILPHFIHTMSVMTHASRHSPAYLAIIAPT
ncbi:telomere binding protein, partial [Serendipita sp. 405]